MRSRQLPANANLGNLKKQAKALLKTTKEDDPDTLSRVSPYFPNPRAIALQDAQLVVAREYGFSSWNKMKTHVESGNATAASPDQLANEFLRHVVLLYSETETADPARWQHARELLDRNRQILDENIYVASAVGDTERIQRWLDVDPGSINRKGGHFNWEPLMYATYSRLPGVSTYAAGELLVRNGANPNAFYMWGGQYRFTALTGVFGEGEGGPEKLPEHPECVRFARLLLTAGADANDSQAAYNRIFNEDNTCLELLLEFGLGSADKNNWFLLENDKLVPHPQETLHYQFCNAVERGLMERVKLIVANGVDVNKKWNDRTPYQMAMLGGHQAVARLLLENGAEKTELGDVDLFRMACLSADRKQVQNLLEQNPVLVSETLAVYPDILEKPVDANRIDALALMIESGFDVNQFTYRTALHQAAWHGRVEMISLLIDAGADPTLRDSHAFSPPLGWAIHNNQPLAVAHLEKCEMDIFTAAARGNLQRLQQMLHEKPALIEQRFSSVSPNAKKTSDLLWMTPLAFAVQANQIESVEFLLDNGADSGANNGRGHSVLDMARERDNPDIVTLLQNKK